MAFYLESRIKPSMLGQVPWGPLARSWSPRENLSLPCLRYRTSCRDDGEQWHRSVIYIIPLDLWLL